MPGTWDPVLYRDRARRWREEAESLPAGKDRDACMALAEGYTKLAALIEGRVDRLDNLPPITIGEPQRHHQMRAARAAGDFRRPRCIL
jgi:hypothetical protein